MHSLSAYGAGTGGVNKKYPTPTEQGQFPPTPICEKFPLPIANSIHGACAVKSSLWLHR